MKKNILYILYILIAVLIQFWFLFLTFRYPHTGIVVEKNASQQWVIANFDESTAGFDIKLEIGDIIERVDNKLPEDHQSIVKWRTVDQVDHLVISRNGMEFQVATEKIRSYIDYLSLVGETFCFFIAAFILLTLRGSRSASYLAIVFINIGLIFMSLLASIRGDSLGKLLITSLMMLLPVVFYHFLHVFFTEKGSVRFSNRLLVPLYAVAIAAFVLRFGFFIPEIAYPVYSYNNNVTIIFFMLGMLLNFYRMTSLLVANWRSNDSIGILIKTVWISICVSFLPFATFSFLPLLLFGHPWIPTFYTGWGIMFFPLSFTYLIATRQLYDIHIVLRRMMLTTAISVLPSMMICGFIYIIFQQHVTARHVSFLFCFTLFLLSVVLYSLEYMATKLERIMFPRKFVLQSALKNIAKSLGNISSFRELKDIILVDIVSALQVYGGAIVFCFRDGTETIEAGDIDLNEVERLIAEGVVEHPSYLIFEVNSNEEYTSYLITTRKKTNTLLGMEEVQWLNLIISYLSVSMENIFLIRKLTMKLQHLAAQMPNEQVAQDLAWFRKLMFELQEKERVRIATDIHDTTMQDLFFLKRRLSSILSRYVYNAEDKDHMMGLMEYVDVINTNLRQSCFELHPHLLQEIGLLQTVHKLIEQESAASPFSIDLITSRASAIEYRSLETKRHIFRIVQEMLNNAKKHSLASKVSIHLSVVQDTFYMLYEDDGIGFDQVPVVEQIGASGIGMDQMRSRILFLNGNLELKTSRGNGVKIWITMPLKEGMTA